MLKPSPKSNSSKTWQEQFVKLYGRKTERQQLYDGYSKIVQNQRGILLIHGPSGIGKTALSDNLYRRHCQDAGFFIKGKWSTARTPYEPLLSAFGDLVRQIPADNTEEIEQWQIKMNTLRPYSDLLTHLIPELKRWIQPQAHSSEQTAEEIKMRFRQAIQVLLSVFATANHPLYLFLDDLHLMDEETADLFNYLLGRQRMNDVMIIGTYRDEEIGPSHPLTHLIENVQLQNVDVIRVTVNPLIPYHLKEWIEDLFTMSDRDLYFLCKTTYRITQGNPLFISQVIQECYDEKIIYYEKRTEQWKIHDDFFKKLSFNDSIFDFIIRRFEKLPHDVKVLISFASCLGYQFDLEKLSHVFKQTKEMTRKLLEKALDKGLIIQVDERGLHQRHPPAPLAYCFLHDKIQQAIYEALPTDIKEEYHKQIGIMFLDISKEEEPDHYIFEIARHFNRCSNRLEMNEKMSLADWNKRAGDKAKKEAAFSTALFHYETSMACIPKNKRDVNGQFLFNTLLGIGETAYLTHAFYKAEQTFNQLLRQAASNTDKSRIYNLKVLLYTHTQQTKKALDSGLAGLRLLGLTIKENPSKWHVAKEYMQLKTNLLSKKPRSDFSQVKLSHQEYISTMRTLVQSVIPAYHENQNLAAILVFKAMRFTHRYGESEMSPIVYINYALTLSAGLQDYQMSYDYGQKALSLAEHTNDSQLKTIVMFTYACFIHHWRHPLKENLDYLEKSQQLAIESGNLHVATANSAFIGAVHLMKGESLTQAKEAIVQQFSFAKQHEFPLSYRYLQEILTWIERLSHPNMNISWNHPSFVDDASAKIMHYTLRLQMTYLFNNESEAIAIMEKLAAVTENSFQLIVSPECDFYQALWIAKLLRQKKQYTHINQKKLLRHLKKLKKYADQSPQNYQHKYLLVKAECLATKQKKMEAMQLYQQAADTAANNSYLQDTALLYACAGEFYLEQQLPEPASMYFNKAYQAYIQWGATSLAYNIAQTVPVPIQDRNTSFKQMSETNQAIDLYALFDAATVLAQETSSQQLLFKLIDIIRLHSRAERVLLVLKQDQSDQIAAAFLKDEGIKVYPKEQLDYPVSLFDYVTDNLDMVLLPNASQTGHFKHDLDIVLRQVKSVLCLPMLYQGKLSGILYIENNEITQAFSSRHVLLFTLLSSQAAVALENASWYDQLEIKIQERTAMLHQTNKELTKTNQMLAEYKEKRHELLSKIAHDLKSPLVAIRGYVDLIIEGVIKDPERQLSYLKKIQIRLTSMERLLQDLMELAQLELKSIEFKMDFIPADQLFTYLTQQFEGNVEKDETTFYWNLPGPSHQEYPLLEVDISRIVQVVGNLLDNAVAHAEKNDIFISLSLENHGEIIITIEDNGHGIPQTELPYVFERYYTNRSNGHGLGLAICKEIIERHQGDIWMTSEFGKGTKVYISLPTIRM